MVNRIPPHSTASASLADSTSEVLPSFRRPTTGAEALLSTSTLAMRTTGGAGRCDCSRRSRDDQYRSPLAENALPSLYLLDVSPLAFHCATRSAQIACVSMRASLRRAAHERKTGAVQRLLYWNSYLSSTGLGPRTAPVEFLPPYSSNCCESVSNSTVYLLRGEAPSLYIGQDHGMNAAFIGERRDCVEASP
jgi:hypothetical protein